MIYNILQYNFKHASIDSIACFVTPGSPSIFRLFVPWIFKSLTPIGQRATWHPNKSPTRAKFGPSCFFLSLEKNPPSFFAWRKEKNWLGFRKSTFMAIYGMCLPSSFCLPIPFFVATSSGCVGRCFATQRVPWQHWFSCEKHLPWTPRKTSLASSQIAWVA